MSGIKVMILAAGYAVRLQPLTTNTPKPLLRIGGRAIIDRIMDKLDKVDDIKSPVYVITNDKFFGNFDIWAKSVKHRCGVSIINDGSTTNDNRLGAIKDMSLVIESESISDDLLVIAGDNLFDFDIKNFLAFANKKNEGVSVALHDIGDIGLAKNFGVVAIDGDNKVVEFQEKPENPKTTLISTGIYYFPKNKLSFIKEYVKMQNKMDAPGYYMSWLAQRDKVYGFAFKEDWYDIGNIESYKKADGEYFKKEKGA